MNTPRYFSSNDEGAVQCTLCPRRCLMAQGKVGVCKVRLVRNGNPALPFYGFITAMAVDPIEKKPLYHYRPGSEILSIGFAGCNLHCPFCQNWHISQNIKIQKTDASGRIYTPAEIISAVEKTGKAASRSIAYTYSEPLVHAEFLLDCMNEAKKSGIANVLVTNGCINSEAGEEILGLCDAVNIDLKCFSKETYENVLGGDLSAVLDFIHKAIEKGVHVEVTTLVVPDLNDSEEELDACMNFIAGLKNGEEASSGKSAVPWHLSAYHPDWKWNAPPTGNEILERTAARARKCLEYVYTGNVAGEKNNTPCPHCGKILIKRHGYNVDTSRLLLNDGIYFCASCGKKAPVRY